MKKTVLQSLISAWLVLAIVVLSTGCSDENNSSNHEKNNDPIKKSVDCVLDINNDEPINQGFNYSAVYMCYPHFPDSTADAYSEQDIEIEYKRMKAAGIKRVRSTLRASWAWDQEKNCWNWDSKYMKAVYQWIEDMADMDIEVVLNMQWNFSELTEKTDKMNLNNPFYILSSGGKYDDIIPYYAQWVNDAVQQIVINRKYENVKYIILITEPNHQTYFKDNGYNVLPNEHSQFEQWVKLPKAVDAKLKKSGIRNNIKIVGPCTTYLCDDFLQWTIDEADQYIDVYAHHIYVVQSDIYADAYNDTYKWFKDKAEIVKKTGKDLWEDEYSFTIPSSTIYTVLTSEQNQWHGTQLASMTTAMLNAGIKSSFIWTLVDQKWPEYNQGIDGTDDSWINGVQKNGILPYMKESTIPKASYYVFAMIGKYLNGTSNTVFFGTHKRGICSTMWKDGNGDFSVMCVNSSINDTEFSLKFSQSLNGVKFYRHVYDPTNIRVSPLAKEISSDKEFNDVNDSLTDTIMAGQVIIYTTRAD